MWNKWTYQNSEKLLEFLASESKSSELQAKLLKKVFPQSSSAEAFVLNLCELTTESAVEERLVKRLLAAVQGNG